MSFKKSSFAARAAPTSNRYTRRSLLAGEQHCHQSLGDSPFATKAAPTVMKSSPRGRPVCWLGINCLLVFATMVHGLTGCTTFDTATISIERDPVLLASPGRKQEAAFEPNRGQAHPDSHYLSRTGTSTYLLTHNELLLVTGQETPNAIRLRFSDAEHALDVETLNKQPGKTNYLRGNNPDNWITDIPHFARLRYKEVSPGIDVEFYGKQGTLAFDYRVAPGSDPTAIRLNFDNISHLAISNGKLVAHHPEGQLVFDSPHIYQDSIDGRKTIPGKFIVTARTEAGFRVEQYDADNTLVIDPLITWSSYAGGSADEYASAIALDPGDNIYLSGTTNSVDFPLGSPFQSTLGTGLSAHVMKFDAVTHDLVYSTFIGDNVQETRAIVVDSSGQATIGGSTGSSTWPVMNAIQATKGGGIDAFVTSLNSTGNGLVFSTYLGGTDIDRVRAMAIDTDNRVYLTGPTASENFPLASAWQTTKLGHIDTWVARLNTSGTQLEYSTYLGGSGNDYGAGIAADAAGNATITGLTSSTNFPIAGAVQESNSGGNDIYVTQLDPTGSLAWSTYFGGSENDLGNALTLTPSGDILVAGQTVSTDITVTNAIQATSNGSFEIFLLQLDGSGTTVKLSTYLGGSAGDAAAAVAVDNNNTAFITGTTTSADFPLLLAVQPIYGGSPVDAFVTRVDLTSPALLYSTYLGGNNEDRGRAIAVDQNGNAWVTGLTRSTNFPTILPWQAANAGQTDIFLTKLNTLFAPDGDINLDGQITLADLLTGYQILFGAVTPTAEQITHGDSAPLVNGTSVPDGTIKINDLLLLQRKLFGLVFFP